MTLDMLMPLVDQARVERRTGYRLLISPLAPVPALCGLMISDPRHDAHIAQELAGAVDEVEATGAPCFVLVDDDLCPHVTAAAAELGLTEREAVAGMVLTPSDVREAPATAATVRRVEDDEALRSALEVAAAGFGVPADVIAVLYTRRLRSEPGVAYYLAEVDGEPVATGVGFNGQALVGVYSVATPPAHRRQGYGSAVVARVVADGFAAGAKLAYLQASPLGMSVYAKLGFRPVLRSCWLTRPQTG
jgi:N-acetylglutamate synthase